MHIGYFGGSFDPPHRGHLAVARAARDHFHLDRVLLAPTGRQPLKPNGPEASFADRLRMTGLLCQGEPGVPGEPARWGGEPRLEASAIDAPSPDGQPNYTVDTLRRLHAQLAAEYPGEPVELFAIVGADAFQTLPHWREPEELLRLAQWIVVSRPGYALPGTEPPIPTSSNLAPHQKARIHMLPGVAEPASATGLRAELHAEKPYSPSLTPEVRRYISEQSLYTTPSADSPRTGSTGNSEV